MSESSDEGCAEVIRRTHSGDGQASRLDRSREAEGRADEALATAAASKAPEERAADERAAALQAEVDALTSQLQNVILERKRAAEQQASAASSTPFKGGLFSPFIGKTTPRAAAPGTATPARAALERRPSV